MTSPLFSTQALAFLTILAAGLVFLLVLWIFGAFAGGDDHGGDGHDSVEGGAEHNFPTVSIFSPRIIAIFAVGLGAGGSIATIYGATALIALLIGIGSGLSPAALAVVGMRALYRQQASSEVQTTSAVGKIGTVANEIAPNQNGEVSLYVNGQYMTYMCRGKEPKVYPRGASVRVTSVNGSFVVVEDAV
jgi:membrane protein implicated in regulation of membrane protease activity